MLVMQKTSLSHAKGFSLIELMVAMVVGLFVAAIVATMYVSIIRANSTTVQFARLNMDMQAALDIISRDVQRAGYASGAELALARDSSGHPTSAAVSNAVHTAMFAAVDTDGSALDLTDSCILLRYDANGDGTISGGANPPEIMAYSYDADNHAIDYQEFDSLGDQSCTVNSSWHRLAGGEGSFDVNEFSFELDPAVSSTAATSGAYTTSGQRAVIIRMSGQSASDDEIQLELERKVRLRNDQF